MFGMSKKGLSTALLVCLLAAPVAAAAAPTERGETGQRSVVTGWFGEVVAWVGELLFGAGESVPERPSASRDDDGGPKNSSGFACDGGGSMDPLGGC